MAQGSIRAMIALICIDNATDQPHSELIASTIYRDAQRRQRDLERIAIAPGDDSTKRFTNFQLVVMPGKRSVGVQKAIVLVGKSRFVRWVRFRYIPMPLQRKKDETVLNSKIIKKKVKR